MRQRSSCWKRCSPVSRSSDALLAEFETAARERLVLRDLDDWPALALALAVNAPVWTEDTDFFGTGVATWTTRNVEIYLGEG